MTIKCVRLLYQSVTGTGKNFAFDKLRSNILSERPTITGATFQLRSEGSFSDLDSDFGPSCPCSISGSVTGSQTDRPRRKSSAGSISKSSVLSPGGGQGRANKSGLPNLTKNCETGSTESLTGL